MEKKILFSGDLVTGTGPATVNRNFTARSPWLAVYRERPSLATVVHYASRSHNYGGVLVSGLSLFNVALLLLARGRREPAWYLAHAVSRFERTINGDRSIKVRVVETLTMHLATGTLSVSGALQSLLERFYPSVAVRGKVVLAAPPPTEASLVQRSNQIPTEVADRVGRIRVVTVGTKPIKNLPVFLSAFSRVKDDSVELIVVGDFREDQLPCRDPRVRFVGSVAHEDVLRILRSTDVYVQISLFESFGLAVCEAASAGCEILVSKSVGCLPLLAGMGEGNIVQDEMDEVEVAEKLENLISCVRNGRATAHSIKRTWETASRELFEVMQPC